jgi:hypothetical protein
LEVLATSNCEDCIEQKTNKLQQRNISQKKKREKAAAIDSINSPVKDVK